MKKEKYDFLIVGAGLFGCVCAKELTDKGYRVLVIDRRRQIGGNCAVRSVDGRIEHMYGPHIFHTNDKTIWDYLNDIEPFVPYKHKVLAVNGGLQYDFPINRHTLIKVFGEHAVYLPNVNEKAFSNFEEAAISRIGEKLYRLFYHDYTFKQWGRDPKTLPAELFSRVPVRFDYDDSYFNDKYTGILDSNMLFEKLLKGASLRLNCPYNKRRHGKIARCIIYTGMVDEYKNYCFGRLPYIQQAESFVHYSGAEKKEYVMTKANQYAIDNGIEFDQDMVSKKIEELVTLTKEVNKREKDIVVTPVAPPAS